MAVREFSTGDVLSVYEVPRDWSEKELHEHLQGVVDLEFWTIPYYLAVMYSIKDPSCEAYRLIQSAVYQEMLHALLAANIANAFGYTPTFNVPAYGGDTVPHIDFNLDEPNPTELFTPYTAQIGPLDETRLNTMCLIEYPQWDTRRKPDLRGEISSYGSIGEFYAAVGWALAAFADRTRGNYRQVDQFAGFYNAFPQRTVTDDGLAGYRQAIAMLSLIVDQGEGQTEDDAWVAEVHRNTADGYDDRWPHYHKFMAIRNATVRPAVYPAEPEPKRGTPGYAAQQRLIADFRAFVGVLNAMVSGKPAGDFGPLMAKLGGDVLTCWQRGAVPRFS
jgi:hypothetical protein